MKFLKEIINLRKWFLCGLLSPKKGTWLYQKADCKRYEPKPETVTVGICLDNLPNLRVANPYCSNKEKREFIKGKQPTIACTMHKKPVKVKLDPARSLAELKIIYSGFFPKCALINNKEYSWDNLKKFFMRVAREDLANVLKMFPYGVWRRGAQTSKVVNFPHPIEDGKFQLHKKNQVWLDQALKTAAFVRELGIIPDICGKDNCQFHEPDPWKYHWLYRHNNHGYNGMETHDNSEVNCHYPQYSYVERGHWEKNYGISSEDQMNEDQRKDMIGCRTTEQYFIEFDNWFIEQLKKELGNEFLYSKNEMTCADGYHEFEWRNVFGPQGIPKERLFTSFDFRVDPILRAEWYWAYQKQIFKFHSAEQHTVYNAEIYEDFKKRKTWTDDEGKEHEYWIVFDKIKPILISTDGQGNFTGSLTELRKLARAVFADGHSFFRADWLDDDCDFEKLDYIGAGIIRDEAALRAVIGG